MYIRSWTIYTDGLKNMARQWGWTLMDEHWWTKSKGRTLTDVNGCWTKLSRVAINDNVNETATNCDCDERRLQWMVIAMAMALDGDYNGWRQQGTMTATMTTL
jgi:hypothetical protein